MKLFVLAVLAAVVLFDLVASDSPATPECAAGENKQVDCNTCMCANGNWACTRQVCPHAVEKRDTEETCRHGSYSPAGDGCNLCYCNEGDWACSHQVCKNPPTLLSLYDSDVDTLNPTEVDQCVEGAVKMDEDDCNTCYCIGTRWTCTKMDCHSVDKQSRSRRETPLEECVDGDTKMEDCNRCMCRNRLWACTRISCPPKSRDKRGYHTSVSQATSGREKRCQPGSSWKLDCNTCTCSKNSRFAYCTERGCLSPGLGGDFPSGISLRGEEEAGAVSVRKRRSPPDVSGQTCTPGTSYQNDCNTCTCPPDGQTAHAACTLKACL